MQRRRLLLLLLLLLLVLRGTWARLLVACCVSLGQRTCVSATSMPAWRGCSCSQPAAPSAAHVTRHAERALHARLHVPRGV
jgi:hypothetical protein